VWGLGWDELPPAFPAAPGERSTPAARAHPTKESVDSLSLPVGLICQMLFHRAQLYGPRDLKIKEKSLERLFLGCYNTFRRPAPSPDHLAPPVQNVWKLCKTLRLSGSKPVKR
jgi:hypothetical protein